MHLDCIVVCDTIKMSVCGWGVVMMFTKVFFSVLLCLSLFSNTSNTEMGKMKAFGLGIVAIVISEIAHYGAREGFIGIGSQFCTATESRTKKGAAIEVRKKTAQKFDTLFCVLARNLGFTDIIKIPMNAIFGFDNIVTALLFNDPRIYALGVATDLWTGLIFHGGAAIGKKLTGKGAFFECNMVFGPCNAMRNGTEDKLLALFFDTAKYGIKMLLICQITKQFVPAFVLQNIEQRFIFTTKKLGMLRFFI